VSAILTALAEFRRSHRCGDGGSTPPELPNPIDDFYAKFVGARYVNDRGTAQEKTVTAGVEALLTATPEGDPFLTPSGLPSSAPVSPAFNPLGIGKHTNTVFVTMSERHCNGLPPGARTPRQGGEGSCSWFRSSRAGPDARAGAGLGSAGRCRDRQRFRLRPLPTDNAL